MELVLDSPNANFFEQPKRTFDNYIQRKENWEGRANYVQRHNHSNNWMKREETLSSHFPSLPSFINLTTWDIVLLVGEQWWTKASRVPAFPEFSV